MDGHGQGYPQCSGRYGSHRSKYAGGGYKYAGGNYRQVMATIQDTVKDMMTITMAMVTTVNWL